MFYKRSFDSLNSSNTDIAFERQKWNYCPNKSSLQITLLFNVISYWPVKANMGSVLANGGVQLSNI